MQANSLTPSVLLLIVDCRRGGGYKMLNGKQIKECGVTRTAAVWQTKELSTTDMMDTCSKNQKASQQMKQI